MTGLEPRQFVELVVRPVLLRLEMWSPAAEQLVLGTAAHESQIRYLKQLNGPALGIYQIEPDTHDDLWANWLSYRNIERGITLSLAAEKVYQPPHNELIVNLAYATAVCRLIYRRVKDPLPTAGDLFGLANYWKKHYNTHKGRGRVDDWVLHFPMEVLKYGH